MDDLSTATWRKSSRSGNTNAECVEVALTDTCVGVRDSKNPAGAVLTFSHEQWRTFLTGIKTGDFTPS